MSAETPEEGLENAAILLIHVCRTVSQHNIGCCHVALVAVRHTPCDNGVLEHRAWGTKNAKRRAGNLRASVQPALTQDNTSVLLIAPSTIG